MYLDTNRTTTSRPSPIGHYSSSQDPYNRQSPTRDPHSRRSPTREPTSHRSSSRDQRRHSHHHHQQFPQIQPPSSSYDQFHAPGPIQYVSSVRLPLLRLGGPVVTAAPILIQPQLPPPPITGIKTPDTRTFSRKLSDKAKNLLKSSSSDTI